MGRIIMNKVKIFCDSTADLSKELIERYDVTVLPMPVLLGDRTCLDGIDATPDEVYNYYETTGHLAKTSALNMASYEEYWKPWVEEGYEIVHISLGAGFSGTFNAARLAAEELKGVYPIDSASLSSGIALIVIEACELRDAGKSAKEIFDIIEERKLKSQASFLVGVIEYLWKGGRCSSVAALGANVLSLKPRIDVVDGKMISQKKYRGKIAKCFNAYADDLLKDRDDIQLDRIFVTHSGIDQEIVDAMVAKVKEHQPGVKEIIVNRAGCTISCHCGPGTLGILYMYK